MYPSRKKQSSLAKGNVRLTAWQQFRPEHAISEEDRVFSSVLMLSSRL
jgi:hypothetical protein